ncbi:hypothetical protein [Amycolatopsis panacis]|uniref:DNA primase n=1 Tax=Amycolatopsis panacis TaxID=2340917 RepID=A0A419I228_9PSEU|nr:hypothetical protein [Amycolatopsis panacis]RJQ83839.1 hypothetical protein D5S19_18700 [Amycolatopsis panacis]
MKSGARVALAIGAGYLLGRSKKMRLALMIAAAGATGRVGTSPGKLLQNGLKQLASSPELGKLTDLAREELLGAAKSAAVTAASSRIESLNERLQSGGSEEDEDEHEEQDEDEGAEDETEEESEAETEEEKPRRRRASSKDQDDQDDQEEAEHPRRRRASSREHDDGDAHPRRRAAAETEPERPARRRTASPRSSSSAKSTRRTSERAPVRRARR